MELSLHTLKELMTTDFAIDMLVNIVGYLIAGAVGILVYRLFHSKSEGDLSEVADSAKLNSEKPSLNQPTAVGAAERRVQFIRFGERPVVKSANRRSTATGAEGSVGRRNRTEIIRVARSMIKAGATHDSIRKVLPISEAELSLLSTNNS